MRDEMFKRPMHGLKFCKLPVEHCHVSQGEGFDVCAYPVLVLPQGQELPERPYITIGMLSFAILVPLAITSNNAMIRRLGGAAWARLHLWVYLAAGAAAVHYLLVVKSWPMEAVVYATIVGLLLSYRVIRRLRGRRRMGLASA